MTGEQKKSWQKILVIMLSYLMKKLYTMNFYQCFSDFVMIKFQGLVKQLVIP